MPKGIRFPGSSDPHSAKFSQCGGALVVTLETGFKVFNIDPITAITTVKVDIGGLQLVEPLFRTNLYALVPSGSSKEFPDTSLYFYDTFQHKIINFLTFGKTIQDVYLSKDIVVVHLKDCVKIYNVLDLMFLDEIDCSTTEQSHVAVSTQQGSPLVACTLGKYIHLLWINNRKRVVGEIKAPGEVVGMSMWNASHLLVTTKGYSVVYDVQNVTNPRALLLLRHPLFLGEVSSVFTSGHVVLCCDGLVYVYTLGGEGDTSGIGSNSNSSSSSSSMGGGKDNPDTAIPSALASVHSIGPDTTYNPKVGKGSICSLFAGGISLVYDKRVLLRLQLNSRSMKITGRVALDKHVLK